MVGVGVASVKPRPRVMVLKRCPDARALTPFLIRPWRGGFIFMKPPRQGWPTRSLPSDFASGPLVGEQGVNGPSRGIQGFGGRLDLFLVAGHGDLFHRSDELAQAKP